MFKNHPVGLRVLFFTEMWERFGFYILMAIFVLYMDHEFGWPDERKADLYGFFLFAVYAFPILGGWLGDRVLGHQNTVRLGASLMVAGYIALAASSADRVWAFYAGLLLVSVGTGIFKSNMSVTVGGLYDSNPALKDAGFNIYYMGVNLGAAIAPIAATILHTVFDSYRLSFAAAAVGMAVGMVTLQMGRSRLPDTRIRPSPDGPAGPVQTPSDRREDRQRVVSLALLFVIVIFFWVAFYQNGFALTLFAQRATVPSSILKPETYQFFNPFFIFTLTPIAVALFGRWRARGKEPTSAVKIFFGMMIAGFYPLVMVFASLAGGDADRNTMSPLWLVGAYFAVTLAEILVSPMGQSYVTKVAPARIKGLMIGFWFGATALGGWGAGLLGRFYDDVPHHLYYLIVTALLFVSGLLILLALRRLNRFAP